MSRTRRSIPPAAIDAAFKLGHMVEQRAEHEQRIHEQVEIVLGLGGDWTTVGIALGTSKQAAWARYAKDATR